jgi:hypothetical protein
MRVCATCLLAAQAAPNPRREQVTADKHRRMRFARRSTIRGRRRRLDNLSKSTRSRDPVDRSRIHVRFPAQSCSSQPCGTNRGDATRSRCRCGPWARGPATGTSVSSRASRGWTESSGAESGPGGRGVLRRVDKREGVTKVIGNIRSNGLRASYYRPCLDITSDISYDPTGHRKESPFNRTEGS